MQVIECQKWKDLKHHPVNDPDLKDEKTVPDRPCLVWSHKGQMRVSERA